MARIAGVDLPREKRVLISLTYIYGIGRSRSAEILESINVDKDRKVKDLTEEEVTKIRKKIQDESVVEGELRKRVKGDISRLVEINSYRGTRHRKGLPCRGQRTKTNARSRKGPRRRIVKKKS